MRVLRFLLRRSWRRLVLAMVAGAASGLAAAAVIALVHRVLAAGPPAATSTIVAFATLALFSVAAKSVAELLLTRLGQGAIAEIRAELSARIVAAPLRQIEELGGHRILATLNDDATTI